MGSTGRVPEWRDAPSLRATEGGVAVRREECWLEGPIAAICLERDATIAVAAITCGVSGRMVHTRFFGSLSEGHVTFEAMKGALVDLALADVEGDDGRDAVAAFVARFP